MKRCFMWIVNRFTKWVHRMKIEEKIVFSLSTILGIVVGVMFFVSIDITPVTSSDYESLENQMEDIEQNPNLLLKTKCNISISDDVITATFSNDECKLTVQYDEKFRVLTTCKTDNYIFWPWAFVISVLIGYFIYIVVSLMFVIVAFFFEGSWEFICNRLNSIKSKRA